MKKLTGADVRDLRKANRCPDCRSVVNVNRRTAQVDVRHDDTCPMLARLRRAGRTSALVFLRAPHQTREAFASEVAEAVTDLAQRTGGSYQIRDDPYRGMPA